MARRLISLVLTVLLGCTAAYAAGPQDQQSIKLPAPQTTGGKPLMEALKGRHSTREFDTTPLSMQTLSNLLWAGFGVNREDGRRTAPSAMNWQEMDIYVFLPQGTYVYQATENALKPIAAADLRSATGSQPGIGAAPLNLVYVADYSKITRGTPEQKDAWSPAHAGFIAQNVYLFCASEGLNVVVRGLVDKTALGQKLQLRPDQKIWLAQTVGYPRK